jgi:AcrR family transcriptional regulator
MFNIVSPRPYALGRRAPSVARTREAILAAARRLLAEDGAEALSLDRVAAGAGVSRITVYHHFGSRSGLLQALLEAAAGGGGALEAAWDLPDPREALRAVLAESCRLWAAERELLTGLGGLLEPLEEERRERLRGLVARLAEAGMLRPGCSTREAADVLGLLASFPAYDRLCREGHRPAAAVAGTLLRLAAAVIDL